MARFAERLKALREEAGMTQAQLARQVHLDPTTISTYESKDDRLPSLTVLKAMADFFGVSTDYLLGRSDFRRGVPEPLESEWPEGIRVLRRASRAMTPEERQFITEMIQTYLRTKEQERKKGK